MPVFAGTNGAFRWYPNAGDGKGVFGIPSGAFGSRIIQPKMLLAPSRRPEADLLQQWNMKELAESEREDEQVQHEELVGRTLEVLEHHRGEAPEARSGKRDRSPLPEELPRPPKRSRRGRRGRRTRAKGRSATWDGKKELTKIDIRRLRFSQKSCSEAFWCGRLVSELVEDLLDRKVSVSAPFLRLSVFETIDEKTNQRIFRCKDNRRLFALKEYAKKSGQEGLMVNINLFSQSTLVEVQRFIQNTDNTDGKQVRLRKNKTKVHI